ncbi:TetR/AcrR family transcriptional regulator [Paracoccus sp. (in: a-proteobacteria)]|jgi:TetR/AcrR family transcriptional repressor of nem operon|uniref:TetR/AcrR family transcriptional regulator n=1 Tax=Paracoccus sp. TaxID=267 RepID=UPI0035AF8178
MGRSSNEEAQRTRQRIVETASDLFRSKGADHVSLADLTAALGLTTGAFYRHFASKEALLAETYQLAFDRAGQRWQDQTTRDKHDQESLRGSLLRYYLRPNPQGRCPMIAFAEDASRAPKEADLRKAYARGAEDLFRLFMGASTPDNGPDTKAMLLFAAMVGARRLEEAAGGAPWVEDIRKAVLDAATAA